MDFKEFTLSGFAIIVFYGITRLFTRKRRYLLKNGIPAEAIIMSINKTNIEYGKGVPARPLMEIVLQVENERIIPKNITIRQDFNRYEIPQPGDKVNILIDPKNAEYVRIVVNANGNWYIV